MVNTCVVPGCSSRSDRNKVISLHSLLLPNKPLLRRWIHHIGRKNLPIDFNNPNSRVCSRHLINSHHRKLRPDEYPTENLPQLPTRVSKPTPRRPLVRKYTQPTEVHRIIYEYRDGLIWRATNALFSVTMYVHRYGQRRHGSVFKNVAVFRKLSGLRLTSDLAEYCADWELSRRLYPRMGLRDFWEWNVAPENVDIVGPREGTRHLDEVGFVSDVDYSRDGRSLVASSSNGSVYVFEPNCGKLRHRIERAHGDAVSRVKFVSDTQFVSGSADCTVALWDIRKTVRPVNVLRGHSKPIRSLHYDCSSDMIVSSCQDGEVRYWNLPFFKAAAEAPPTGTPAPTHQSKEGSKSSEYQGKLFTCRNFARLCMNDETLIFTNSQGTIFIIDNLDVRHLQQDLKNIRFDDSIKIQLGWFSPNASPDKRNRIRVVDSEEYIPVPGAMISNVMSIALHPNLPAMLLRLTTSVRNYLHQQVQDWTCICNMKQQLCQDTLKYWHTMSSYGSDIIEETLLFGSEETRFASFREKQPSFSKCGRVIASPDKLGVRLLAFSHDLDTCDNVQLKKKHRARSVFSVFENPEFWPSGPTELVTVEKLERSTNSTLCCKFSPVDMLLAVGDANSCVSFYQPVL